MSEENKPTHAWGIAGLALGIAGLILGIMGLFFSLASYIGILLSITAVVFCGIQKKHEPTGAATAGLAIGIIGIILNVVLIFVVGFFFVSVGSETAAGHITNT